MHGSARGGSGIESVAECISEREHFELAERKCIGIRGFMKKRKRVLSKKERKSIEKEIRKLPNPDFCMIWYELLTMKALEYPEDG